jgi:hypothetical protein
MEERLADIFSRYGEDTAVHQNMQQQCPYFWKLREKYGEIF